MKCLLIGGTGPTGPYIVNGLIERGWEVCLLNRGNHRRQEIPDSIETLVADPYDEASFTTAIAGRHFDLCISAYGRLRMIAGIMVGHCDRFIAFGGAPAYRGYMNPLIDGPAGPAMPLREEATLVSDPAEDEKGFRIQRSESALFQAIPHATHFRFPIVYGPHQPIPREWLVIRRILDGRRQIILPDGGHSILGLGYAGNIAHAVLLAADNPEQASGHIFNVADARLLTLRQWVESIAKHMRVDLEIISLPWELATPCRPMLMQPAASHRFQDTGKLIATLGYADATDPVKALGITADWLCANRPEPGGTEEWVLEDPFDYEAEEWLIKQWASLNTGWKDAQWKQKPGFTMAYSGPEGRARSNADFKE